MLLHWRWSWSGRRSSRFCVCARDAGIEQLIFGGRIWGGCLMKPVANGSRREANDLAAMREAATWL
jgi:hypothetical protein